ncbi:Transcriptional regulatory protein-like protein [Emericellopsis cladophorae]|uniref:Transcriptional regulatory protein-like protein n=1 Tax=Emericellopsis cladophorae TaxID=2686198 RepID=A0A9P9Y632_9HYPO|nr:Transcriptional regulatory protein-like protein [Emericellopsis cladophorae]KAI6783720.1 Transcriptional regulatory protein-like protein [Emericellopsis cladophorae]
MATPVSAPPVLSPPRGDGVEPEDSNISSPLSDVANDEDMDTPMAAGDEDSEDADSLSGGMADAAMASEDESALSDAQSVGQSEGNDTEAETERLYDTPQHQRSRDVVVDQFNEDHVFEHTPSKLRREALAQDEEAADDQSSAEDDAYSGGDKSETEASPSKVATTKDTSVDDEHQHDSQERKRKRSLATDGSDPEQPLRKRAASVVPAKDKDEDIPEETAAVGEVEVDNERSGPPSVADEVPSHEKTDLGETTADLKSKIRKKTTRSISRRKDSDDDAGGAATAPQAERDTEAEAEAIQEPMDAEAEEEADIAAKNAEEAERKAAAFRDWSKIEEMFGVFRDKIYKTRLQKLENEEQSLLADDPTHQDFIDMKKCLDDRLEQKLREIEKEHEFRIKANERKFVAIRSQVWGQFVQSVRERRESALESLNRDWYDVQLARRNAHSLPDYGVIFPKDPTQRLRNAVAYNTEVSTLAGIAKYEGFPARPDIRGASVSEIQDDFAAMEARRSRQRTVYATRDDYQTPSFNRLGPAGEQFLKETPWANPNHSAHRMQQQQPPQQQPQQHRLQSIQADGKAEQQTLNAGSLSTAAIAGHDAPVSQQRSLANSTRPQETQETSRTPLKTSNPMKRTALPGPSRESKTAAA